MRLGLILPIAMALCLCSCTDTYDEFGNRHEWQPHPLWLSGIPEGYDSYSIGFRDGCNTMMGVIGNAMLQSYGFSYDVNRSLQDKDYYLGWRIGQNYCTYYLDKDPI